MQIAVLIARAKAPSPLAEPKRLTSVGESIATNLRHDSDKLSVLKLSAPGADLEGEDERPIPAHSLTNDALDQRRELVGHLQAGKRHVRRRLRHCGDLKNGLNGPRLASGSCAARGNAAHLHNTCMAANAAEPQEAITVSELWTAASPSQEALLLATEDVLEGPPQI